MDMETTTEQTPDTGSVTPMEDVTRPDVSTSKPILTPAVVDGVVMTPTGLKVLKTNISPDDFNTLFSSALLMGRAANWILGDTLDLADRTWGNKATGSKYEQAAKETGMAISTLKNIVCVCHNIPYEQRRPELSFSHHLEALAGAETVAEREAILDRAEDEKMSVRDLRKTIRKEQQVKAVAKQEAEDGGKPKQIFGVTIPDKPVANYPLGVELTRISAWFEDRDLNKIPREQRQEMIGDWLPLLRDVYRLLQLNLEDEPDRDYGLPFPVEPLEE